MSLPATLPDDAPHLLVVDDDRRIRDLLSRFLSSEGYRVTTAETAMDARAKLNGLSFDLLILDVMMPGLSGIEVFDRVRADPDVRNMPVLFVTAATQDYQRQFKDRRVADVISKPFDLNELLAKVRALCPP